MTQIPRFRRTVLYASLVFLAPAAHGQVAPTYSNESLHGTYSFFSYFFDATTTQSLTPAAGNALPVPLGFKTELGTVTFDGAGNASLSSTKNKDGVISPNSSTFTYSVASNGAVTTNQGISGTVVENGRIFIGGDVTSGDDPQIVLLLREEGSSDNTATGANALSPVTTGIENTADGAFSLFANTSGNANAAVGYQALYSNTGGQNNTAFGANALYRNTVGYGNAAQGVNALYSDTTGIRNLGIGNAALYGDTTGSYNIGLGFEGGYNVTTGSNNIEIGAVGTASDNNTIQIGTQGTQTATTIAGIYGSTITGSAVYVNSSGKLGVLASSERFKTDVAEMGEASEKLAQLRPVTFKLKTDPQGTTQYGLIAEEVAKVYPELVIRGADGRIDGVRYEELAPMLLNVVQQQQTSLAAQAREIEGMRQRLLEVQELEKRFDEFTKQRRAD